MARATSMFHPVPRSQWEPLEGEACQQALRVAGISESIVLADERVLVRQCELPFYACFDWYNVVDTRESPARHAFYLIDEELALQLEGDVRTIREVHTITDFKLSRANVDF